MSKPRATVTDLLLDLADVEDRGLHHDDRFTSWADHLRDAAALGAAITERLDPELPPHIGVLLHNTIDFSALVAAAAFEWFVIVGLNTTRRGDALVADIARADCQFVITDADTEHLLDGIPTVAPRMTAASLRTAYRDPVARPRDPDTALMLIFTSGTTGDPKAVRCTHRTFVAAGTMLAERFEIGSRDVVYLSMPMFHSNAMIAGWSVAVAGGASIVLRRKFSARGFVADVKRFGVTYANYVGKPLRYVLDTAEAPDDAEHALRIVYGNEAPARDRERFARRFGCRVVDGFGSTEGGVAITRTPDTPADALGPLRAPTAIVHPDTGAVVPDGQVGEIVNLAGAGVFSGYYNDPDATAHQLRGGIYHTGDLGWVDDAGYVHFAGRLGDWMRVDGENLATAPIERILLRHPDIRQASVYGVPVEIGDEIEAVLVTNTDLDPDQFADFLDTQGDLGPKQWPHRIRIVDALPETATFKTVKRTLRESHSPPTWVRQGHHFHSPLRPPVE